MAKHHPDLIFCRKQPGVGKLRLKPSSDPSNILSLFILLSFSAIGRLCEKCDGKCVICDSYVRPCTLVRICDECNYGSYQGRCVICGGPGVSDAYYCKECTIQEKDVRVSPIRSVLSSWTCCTVHLLLPTLNRKGGKMNGSATKNTSIVCTSTNSYYKLNILRHVFRETAAPR